MMCQRELEEWRGDNGGGGRCVVGVYCLDNTFVVRGVWCL
jgi:hypothetical protein